MENGQLEAFFAQDSIEILRKTKRSEKITDIKPWIYKLELRDDKVWMQLSQGSVHNLKPEYKVILVGDASMAPSELLYRGAVSTISTATNGRAFTGCRRCTGVFRRRSG